YHQGDNAWNVLTGFAQPPASPAFHNQHIGEMKAFVNRERPDVVLAFGGMDGWDLIEAVGLPGTFPGVRFIAIDYDFQDSYPNARGIQFATGQPSRVI